MSARDIVVVGSLNADLVASVPRFPDEGETVSGTDFQVFCGGKGANQAVAAARLGAGVAMMLGIIVGLVFQVGKFVLKALFFAVLSMAKTGAHILHFLFLSK